MSQSDNKPNISSNAGNSLIKEAQSFVSSVGSTISGLLRLKNIIPETETVTSSTSFEDPEDEQQEELLIGAKSDETADYEQKNPEVKTETTQSDTETPRIPPPLIFSNKLSQDVLGIIAKPDPGQQLLKQDEEEVDVVEDNKKNRPK